MTKTQHAKQKERWNWKVCSLAETSLFDFGLTILFLFAVFYHFVTSPDWSKHTTQN